MAKVDVIIPVYNTPIDYIRQAILSVLEQTFSDWQAVIVNDGSGARCTTQLESLLIELKDSRLRYVKSKNQGVAAARNLGIASSDSMFIALLDSDDVWYPDKLARQLKVIKEHPNVSLVFACSDLLFGDDMTGLQRVTAKTRGCNELSQHDACVRMLHSNFVDVNTVMFCRADVESVGLFDENFHSLEDKELWIRMLLAGQRFYHIPETLAAYRIHATNMSKNVGKMRDGRMKLIWKVDSLLDQGPSWLRSEYPALRRSMVRHVYREITETYLESGRFAQALWYAMPWYNGMSMQTARLCATACMGVIGLRRLLRTHQSCTTGRAGGLAD